MEYEETRPDAVASVEGVITLADGTQSRFRVEGETGTAVQCGADRERLGRSVDVLAAIERAVVGEG